VVAKGVDLRAATSASAAWRAAVVSSIFGGWGVGFEIDVDGGMNYLGKSKSKHPVYGEVWR